jgi:hypothetical protein
LLATGPEVTLVAKLLATVFSQNHDPLEACPNLLLDSENDNAEEFLGLTSVFSAPPDTRTPTDLPRSFPAGSPSSSFTHPPCTTCKAAETSAGSAFPANRKLK